MNNAPSFNPEPIQPVRVKRHRVDWEASDLDLAAITGRRAVTLAPQIATGCWFLNPRYTVSSPVPTAEFFRTVLRLRSTWLRTCREVQGTSGQRHLARQVVGQGRLGAITPIDPIAAPGLPSHLPFRSVSIADLPDDQRREVIEAGQIAKTLAYSGILFMDGNPVPPRTWRARADELLNPRPDVPVTITRRRLDLAAFKATGDPEPLRAISRAALQEHLDRHPSQAAYVSPQVTVSALSATHAFYQAVRTFQAIWCTLLNRTLGCGNVRRARRAMDQATVSLVYGGTLVVDRQLYLPGCWPIHDPTSSRVNKTPFQSPTVPPLYLGLTLPRASRPPPETKPRSVDIGVQRAPVISKSSDGNLMPSSAWCLFEHIHQSPNRPDGVLEGGNAGPLTPTSLSPDAVIPSPEGHPWSNLSHHWHRP
jgi:hypothetical protein